MFKRAFLPAIAFSLAAIATPAAANTNTVDVYIGDLNLTTDEGRARMERRLSAAARRVCGGRPDIRDLSSLRAFNDCRAEAHESTREQVRFALEAANARRVAVLADKLGYIAVSF